MRARLRSLARTLIGRDRFDRDLRDEMAFHIEARAEDLMRAGADRTTAMRQARMEFGNVDTVRQDARHAHGVRWIEESLGDLRYTLRLLRKSPGFAVAAVLSLGLGIGANTAIFSLMDAVLLRTLPVERPEELVYFAHGRDPDTAGISSNFPLFERFTSAGGQFSGITAYASAGFTVRTNDGLEMLSGLWAGGNFHAVMGVPFAVGRGFSTEDNRATAAPLIAVISDAFWARRFNRDPNILERSLSVDGRAFTIVGVTSREFTGPIPGLNPDLTIPISVRALGDPEFPDAHDTWTNLAIVGRLRPGVSVEAAQAAADATFQQYMSEPENTWVRKDNPAGFSQALLLPAAKGRGSLRREYETALNVLMGMVAIVLLIASVNVANLLLVRGSARAKEVAIRLCIGGGRSRLIRQFLTESVILAGLGGVLGSALAVWGTAAIVGLFSTAETPPLIDVSPNLRVLAFTTAVTILTGLGFGVMPAIKSTSIDLTPALKDTGSGGRFQRWSSAHLLVGAQVALSVLVLAVAALLVRSLVNLRTLDAGFAERQLLLVTLETNGTPVKPEQRPALFGDVLARLRSLPGVLAVSGSRSTPIHNSGNARALALPNAESLRLEDQLAFTNMVTPEYFDTMGIRLLRGRAFDSRDHGAAPLVAVVNETMARFWAGDRDPVGMTFAFRSEPKVFFTIIGVVADTRQMNLRETPPRTVYTPLSQVTPAPSLLQIEVRTAGHPSAAADEVRHAVRAISNDLVIRYIRTMDQQIDASLVRERLLSTLSAAFAVLALVLSAIGLYGVMSYSVTRRFREIGIRMALGAARGQVLRQVLSQTMIIAGGGTAVGLLAALLATQALSAFLFGLSGRDPVTLAAVAFALLMVSMLAGLLPARKAATLNPVQAIKAE